MCTLNMLDIRYLMKLSFILKCLDKGIKELKSFITIYELFNSSFIELDTVKASFFYALFISVRICFSKTII